MERLQKHEINDPSQRKDSRVNILFVDDDKINQFVVSKHLQKWGFQFMVASSGHEALELIKSKTFQIVLMDLNMPDMDGGEVTKKIRAMDGHYFKNVPILACSAIVTSKEKANALGMTDYASKPLNAVELQSKIVKYVADSTAENASRKISIDFDYYSDGDPEFKQELISLIIRNLVELAESAQNAGDSANHGMFLKTVHKVTPTIAMLNDSEFSAIIHGMQDPNVNNLSYHEKRDMFHKHCDVIIRSLEEEMETQAKELVCIKAA